MRSRSSPSVMRSPVRRRYPSAGCRDAERVSGSDKKLRRRCEISFGVLRCLCSAHWRQKTFVQKGVAAYASRCRRRTKPAWSSRETVGSAAQHRGFPVVIPKQAAVADFERIEMKGMRVSLLMGVATLALANLPARAATAATAAIRTEALPSAPAFAGRGHVHRQGEGAFLVRLHGADADQLARDDLRGLGKIDSCYCRNGHGGILTRPVQGCRFG